MIINLNYFKKFVLCTLAITASIMVHAQTRTIQGVVTNKMGETMIGVSIAIPGTTIGVTTNAEGKYSINVPENATALVFTFIGYEASTIAIGVEQLLMLYWKKRLNRSTNLLLLDMERLRKET